MLSAPGAMAGQATDCPMFKMGDPNGNVCTANDVNLAAAVVGSDNTGAICFPGEQFTVDLEANLTVRSQTRWDIGVWIAQDGKALDVSSDDGGSASCEVVPLPATDHLSDNWTTGDPPSISSFDDSPDATPASQDLCGDTDGLANNDPISGVQLTFGDDPAVFNGPVTLTCIAGPGGGVVLNSLVSWNQNDPGICDPTVTDTYDLATSKCSTTTSELEVDIVGRVTIVKSAPNGVGQNFDFAWTNDSPPADTTLNPALNPFTLQDTQSEEIYAVIGDDGSATVTVNEQNLPVGWQLNNIQCTGDDTTPVVIDGSEITVTLSYDAIDPLASQDDVVCTFNNGPTAPELTLEKTGTLNDDDGTPGVSAGDSIDYAFTVENTGNVTLTNVIVTDPGLTSVSGGPIASFPEGAIDDTTFTGTYIITQADIDAGSFANTATVESDEGVTDDGSFIQPLEQVSGLTLDKTADPMTYSAVSEMISYEFEFTNSGNVTLHAPYTVTDDVSSDEACPPVPASLAPGESVTCTGTYTITQADVDAGSVTNTASGTALDLADQTVPSNEDSVTIDAVITGSLILLKTASPENYDEVGDIISYTYRLTNNMNITLSAPYTIDDDIATDEDCPALPASLAPGEFVDCTASHTITQADIDAGSVINTATGTAQDPGDQTVTSNEDSETVDALVTGSLSLVKTATPPTYEAVDEVISYSYLLTNNMNITLFAPYTIDDDVSTDENCPAVPASLAPGESVVCTASHTIVQGDIDARSVTNTATGTAQDPDDQTVTSNEDSETVAAITGSLTLVKTADPQLYNTVGDVISYSYVMTNDTNVDLYPPYTIDDDIATDENCPIVPNPLVPGDSVTCTASHTIDQADLDARSVVNVASGTAQDAVADGLTITSNTDTETVTVVVTGSLVLVKTATPKTYTDEGEVISYSYLLTNNTNITLHAPYTIDDDIAVDEDCSGLPATMAPGGGTVTCTASHTITAADVTAGFVTNIATGTAQDAEDGGETVTSNEDTETVTTVMINLAKSAAAPSYNAITGRYTVVYTIAASNGGTSAGTYDLTDTLIPATGITMFSAVIAYAGGEVQTGTPAGPLPYSFSNGETVVTGEGLVGGATEFWTVVATFDVDPTLIDEDARSCVEGDEQPGAGFYNLITGVEGEDDTTDNDACTNLPDPSIDLVKTAEEATFDGTTFTVVYTVTANNLADGPGFYDLTDTILPGNGISVVQAQLTAYNAGTENSQSGALAGGLPYTFVSGETLVKGEALAGGRNESWTIVVEFAVDFEEVDDTFLCSEIEGGAGTGFYNEVEGSDSDPDDSNNHACTNPGGDIATFFVTKDFIPDNAMEVHVFISCNDGLPIRSDQVITETSGGVTFVVELFTSGNLDCEITERPVPSGFNDTYVAGALTGVAESMGNIDGCQFEGVIGGDFTCEITNTADDSTYTVTKIWDVIGNGGEQVDEIAYVTISCDKEILSAPGAYATGGSDDDWWAKFVMYGVSSTATVVVDSTDGIARCSASENVESWVETENGCSHRQAILPGEHYGCTITNTVFFEGIPTLNRYSLALLALLMLGIGAVGFRRFS